jgi:hypothetical protein
MVVYMGSENSKLNGNRMEVLGLVSIQPPGPWWWRGEDIESEEAKGIIFRAYGEGQEEELDIAYILVADVTGDPEELNISSLDEDSAKAYDLHLHEEIKKNLPNEGMELIKWMSSQLNETADLKILVTAYIVNDQGKERQNIALRLRVRQSNLVIMGCFDIAMKDQLASPIFDAIRSFVILPPDAEMNE